MIICGGREGKRKEEKWKKEEIKKLLSYWFWWRCSEDHFKMNVYTSKNTLTHSSRDFVLIIELRRQQEVSEERKGKRKQNTYNLPKQHQGWWKEKGNEDKGNGSWRNKTKELLCFFWFWWYCYEDHVKTIVYKSKIFQHILHVIPCRFLNSEDNRKWVRKGKGKWNIEI